MIQPRQSLRFALQPGLQSFRTTLVQKLERHIPLKRGIERAVYDTRRARTDHVEHLIASKSARWRVTSDDFGQPLCTISTSAEVYVDFFESGGVEHTKGERLHRLRA